MIRATKGPASTSSGRSPAGRSCRPEGPRKQHGALGGPLADTPRSAPRSPPWTGCRGADGCDPYATVAPLLGPPLR
eukprot:14904319-Alexandrium_andersonii.AAC.1